MLEQSTKGLQKSFKHPGSYSHIQAISNILNVPPKKRNQFSRNFNEHSKKIVQNLDVLMEAPKAYGMGAFNDHTKVQQHNYGPTMKMGKFGVDLSENYTFPQNKDKKMSRDKQKRKDQEAKLREIQMLMIQEKGPLAKAKHGMPKFENKAPKKYDNKYDNKFDGRNPHSDKPNYKPNKTAFTGKLPQKLLQRPQPVNFLKKSNKLKDGKHDGEKKERKFVNFEEYLPLEEVEEGLESGTLFQVTNFK